MLSLKMDAYDTNDKIAELDQKIEQQSNENNAIQSEIKKILLMSAFTIRLKTRYEPKER